MHKVFVITVALMLIGIGCQKPPQLAKLPAPFLVNEEMTDRPVQAAPVLKESGIFFGDKGLDLNRSGKTMLMAGGRQLAAVNFSLKSPWFRWMSFSGDSFTNKTWDYDQKQKRFVAQAAFPLDKEARTLGTYRQEVALLPDGLIQYDIEYSLPRDRESAIEDAILFFDIPFTACDSGSFTADGKPIRFSSAADPLGEKSLFRFLGKAQSFVFMPGKPETQFAMTFQRLGKLGVEEIRQPTSLAGQQVRIRIYPEQSGDSNRLTRKISFQLDLRTVAAASLVSSPDCHMGIDFWKSDRLHVPNYALCRNLIQNPSFEAGLHYFADTPYGAYIPTKYERLYVTDDSQARFGNRSLLIHAIKGMTMPTTLCTFVIPVIEGKIYTFSCYVKGDKPDGLRLTLGGVSAQWPVFPKLGSCAVTPEWARHHFSFTAPNSGISISMKGSYYGDDPSGEGRIWVDGIQLEEGALSAYVEKPVAAQLLTSNPDNFLAPADKINARLRITGPANSVGKVTLAVQDFYYRELWQGQYPFRTDARGIAELPLPLDGKLTRGIFVVRADFELEDRSMPSGAPFQDTDYFRLAIMEPLQNVHRNKNITATRVLVCSPRSEALMARMQAVGYGACNYGVSPMNENITQDEMNLLKRYNIDHFGHPLLYDGRNGSILVGTNYVVENLKSLTEVTPEMEKKIEEASYEKAKSVPWVNIWFFSGESEWRFDLIKQNKIDEFVKLTMATYRGVKRFNPKAIVLIDGGPCNMMPQDGIRLLDRYLEAVGGRMKFDGVGIHPYRTLPEDPDLDDDAVLLFEMLKKHGYDQCPVYWLEGIWFPPYIIPAWGLNAHKGCSQVHYNAGCPSYHMGWGERIAAAYHARSWLVGLKHQDRVKVFNDWSSWSYMDTDLTPLALQKVPNTLGHLLGNAYFKEDIRFAPKVRCYVFEDEQKRPVAAVWSHIAKVDRGEEECPTAEIAFAGGVPEVFDLMEAPIPVIADREGKCRLEVSSFPVFIRGKSGTLAAMCQALRSARLVGCNDSPIDVSARPIGRSDLDIRFRNLVSRPLKANVVMSVQGKTMTKSLELAEKGVETIKVPMLRALGFDCITQVQLPVTIQEQQGAEVKVDASFEGFAVKKRVGAPIAIDGDLGDWKGIPEIPITNGTPNKSQLARHNEPINYPKDLGATFQMTWDDEALYLAVKVTDDKFVHEEKADIRSRWENDCLQMYVDTACDARSRATKGFDGNDYDYDFFPDVKAGKAIAYRRFAPEAQAAGGVENLKPNEVEPNIKTAFRLCEGGYRYEIAIPRQYLMPMKLEAGTVAGLALYVADRDDGHVKNAVTLTPPGTGGYMTPHLYPVMVLVE